MKDFPRESSRNYSINEKHSKLENDNMTETDRLTHHLLDLSIPVFSRDLLIFLLFSLNIMRRIIAVFLILFFWLCSSSSSASFLRSRSLTILVFWRLELLGEFAPVQIGVDLLDEALELQEG